MQAGSRGMWLKKGEGGWDPLTNYAKAVVHVFRGGSFGSCFSRGEMTCLREGFAWGELETGGNYDIYSG